MVLSYFSLYILAVGGDKAQIGLITSLRPLAGLIMFPLAGALTDLTGRVRLIALGGYLSALTMLLYIFAPSWEWIALGALLQGFMVFHFPPSSAILADSIDPKNRGVGIATMNTLAYALAIFSPYIAGIILELYERGLKQNEIEKFIIDKFKPYLKSKSILRVHVLTYMSQYIDSLLYILSDNENKLLFERCLESFWKAKDSSSFNN